MNTTLLEQNIIHSFALAKKDITKLYESVYILIDKVEKLTSDNDYLNSLSQKSPHFSA